MQDLHHPAPLKANFLLYIQKSNFFSSPYFSESDQLSLFPIVIGFRNKFSRTEVVCLIRLFKLWFLNVVTINAICCLPSATSNPQLPIFEKRTNLPDMKFVQKFTRPDFQVKNFTPPILPNFNSFSKKKTQKMSENGEIYTAGKNFTLPPALTAWTNSTSGVT